MPRTDINPGVFFAGTMNTLVLSMMTKARAVSMVESEASPRTCYKSRCLSANILLVSFSSTHFGAAQNSA